MKTELMLIDFKLLATQLGFHITGVLHLGAHFAEEADLYYSLGVRNVVWVEGNPDLANVLRDVLVRYDKNRVVIALIGDGQGDAVFNVSNHDSLSSSLFEFGTHTRFSPETVFVEQKTLPTRTVDELDTAYEFAGINTLVMDLQGAELLALRGAEKFLNQVEYLYSEVNLDEVYVGCAKFEDMGAYLAERGFSLTAVCWDGHGWGDALWRRK